MKQLPDRYAAIARGETTKSLDHVLMLRERWEAEGYDLPELERGIHGLGDLIHAATSALGIKACRRCRQWRLWLNKHLPISG